MLHSHVVQTNYGNYVLLILQQIQSIVFPLAERWDVARKPKGAYCLSFSRQHIDELIFTFTQYSHFCSVTRNAAVTCNIYSKLEHRYVRHKNDYYLHPWATCFNLYTGHIQALLYMWVRKKLCTVGSHRVILRSECGGTRLTHGRGSEGKTGEWSG